MYTSFHTFLISQQGCGFSEDLFRTFSFVPYPDLGDAKLHRQGVTYYSDTLIFPFLFQPWEKGKDPQEVREKG